MKKTLNLEFEGGNDNLTIYYGIAKCLENAGFKVTELPQDNVKEQIDEQKLRKLLYEIRYGSCKKNEDYEDWLSKHIESLKLLFAPKPEKPKECECKEPKGYRADNPFLQHCNNCGGTFKFLKPIKPQSKLPFRFCEIEKKHLPLEKKIEMLIDKTNQLIDIISEMRQEGKE